MTSVVRLFVLVIISLICMIGSLINFAIGLVVEVLLYKLRPLLRLPEDGNDLSKGDVVSYLEIASILSLCCSVGLFIVSIMGCCTATCVRDIKGCYYMFIGIMIMIVVMQSSATGLSYTYYKRFEEKGETFFKTTLTKKYIGPYDHTDPTSAAWDDMQYSFQCCGVNGQNIFIHMKNWNRAWIKSDKAVIPISCCKFNDKKFAAYFHISKPKDAVENLEDSTCPMTKKSSYKKGCYGQVKVVISTYKALLFISGIILTIVEIIAIISASFIFPRMERDEDGAYKFRYNKMR